MPEVIADTGPLLHLHEIGRLALLSLFERIQVPDLVADELHAHKVNLSELGDPSPGVTIIAIPQVNWQPIMAIAGQPRIHPADAQVFVLAQLANFQVPILTDDLNLRRRLESKGATAVGTIGVLVRAYTARRIDRQELEDSVEDVFSISTLHISQAFKAYVRYLLATL